jgi:hypothetical protein
MVNDTKDPEKSDTMKLSEEDQGKAKKKGGIFGDPVIEI